MINLRYIKPLDECLIVDQVRKKKSILSRRYKVITIEDGVLTGGVGEGIRDLIIKNKVRHVDILNLGVPENEVPVATRKELLSLYGLDENGLYKGIRAWVNGEASETLHKAV